MKKFLDKENFFQGTVKAYIMDKLHSVDIDHALDLDYANMLIEKKYINITI
jgi:CMP-N-acetylneuraminic acid synthetase